MKKLISFIFGATLVSVFFGTTMLADSQDDNGGLISLRGETQLAEGQQAVDLKKVKKSQCFLADLRPKIVPHISYFVSRES